MPWANIEKRREYNRERSRRLRAEQSSIEREEYNAQCKTYRTNNLQACKIRVQSWAQRNPERRREVNRRWERANPEKTKAKWLRRWYKLSLHEYQQMLEDQLGRCAVCLTDMRPPVVDHCHKTGKVRALLCGLCNSSIGMAKDDSKVLRSMAAYLDKHNAD